MSAPEEVLFQLLDVFVDTVQGEFVVYLIGKTMEGRSICLPCHGWHCGVYAESRFSMNELYCQLMKAGLSQEAFAIREETRLMAYGYERNPRTFYYVGFRNGNDYFKGIQGMQRLPGVTLWETHKTVHWVQQAMACYGWSYGDWIRVPDVKVPLCRTFKVEPSFQVAPWVMASLDIECFSSRGKFPHATCKPDCMPNCGGDPVILIVTLVQVWGKPEEFRTVVHITGETEGLEGEIYSALTEGEMLAQWNEWMKQLNPDFIVGYNHVEFDLPYLQERAKLWDIEHFAEWSRVRSPRLKREGLPLHKRWTGQTYLDVMLWARDNWKFNSYTLDVVSRGILGLDQGKIKLTVSPALWEVFGMPPPPRDRLREIQDPGKRDIASQLISDNNYHRLFGLWKLNHPLARSEIVRYCLCDAVLPLRILQKRLVILELLQMAQITYTSTSNLLYLGQTIKVWNQVYRASRKGYVLNVPGRFSSVSEGGYQGAIVLEPLAGFYRDRVTTLDFASLYPSIIISQNLCCSTLNMYGEANPPPRGRPLPHFEGDPEVRLYEPGDGCQYEFVQARVRKGIIPQILENILTQRGNVKKDMSKHPADSETYQILNARQNALKRTANSMYGSCAAPNSPLPCLPVAIVTTYVGRTMIQRVQREVEAQYQGARVLYGDTDSVMIHWGKGITMQEAFQKGLESAERMTKLFRPPIKLAFEKVYCPYLLCQKKNYAALKYEKLTDPPVFDVKGLAMVKRDQCEWVRETQKLTLDTLFHGTLPETLNVIERQLNLLVEGQLPVTELVITEKLKKEYANRASVPHVVAADRHNARGELIQYTAGDRVPYVIRKGRGSISSRADTLEGIGHQLREVDSLYYLDACVKMIQTTFGLVEDLALGPVCQKAQRRLSRQQTGQTSLDDFRITKKQCVS